MGGRTIQFDGLASVLGIATILALEGELQDGGYRHPPWSGVAGYLFGKWPLKPDP